MKSKKEINHEGHEGHEEKKRDRRDVEGRGDEEKKKTKRRMGEVDSNGHLSHPSFRFLLPIFLSSYLPIFVIFVLFVVYLFFYFIMLSFGQA
jgi:hypothetical protein